VEASQKDTIARTLRVPVWKVITLPDGAAKKHSGKNFLRLLESQDFDNKEATAAGWAAWSVYLHEAFRATTALYNEAVRQCIAHDDAEAEWKVATNAKTKQPKPTKGKTKPIAVSTIVPKVLSLGKLDTTILSQTITPKLKAYVSGISGDADSDLLDSQAFYGVLRQAVAYYGRSRYAIRTGKEQARFYRYPTPVPVRCSVMPIVLQPDPTATNKTGYRVVVGIRRRSQWFAVLLAHDYGHARQLKSIMRTAEGAHAEQYMKHAEVSPLKKADSSLALDHKGKVIAGICVHVPIDRDPSACSDMLIETCPDALLTCTIDGVKQFTFNADELPTLVQRLAESGIDKKRMDHELSSSLGHIVDHKEHHSLWVQRINEDRKSMRRAARPPRVENVGAEQPRDLRAMTPFERRQAKRARQRSRKRVVAMIDKRCDKMHRRLSDSLHKITAAIVNYAVTRRCGTVTFRDHTHAYLGDKFQWFRLKGMIGDKLAVKGIEYHTADLTAKEVAE
jgi:hypothetical protein